MSKTNTLFGIDISKFQRKEEVDLNKDINLLPSYIFEEQYRVKKYNKILFLWLGIFLCVALFAATRWAAYNDQQSKNDSFDRRISSLESIEKLENQLSERKGNLTVKENYEVAIDKANTAVLSSITVMDIARAQAPSDIKITGLTDSVGESDKIKKTTLNGTCSNNESVAEFQEILRASDMFSSVFVPQLSQSTNRNSVGYTFSIVCTYKDKSGDAR